MTAVGVIANEVGNLGITAQLEGSSREVEVPFETLTISFMQLVLQFRQLAWCLLHGWSQYLLCGSACLKCQQSFISVLQKRLCRTECITSHYSIPLVYLSFNPCILKRFHLRD